MEHETTATADAELSIAHVHWAFPPTTGGTESHLADLARRQAEAGLRVAILTGEPDPVVPEGCWVETTPFLDLEQLRRRPRRQGRLLKETKATFLDFVDRHRVQVVHGHNLHHFFPTPALALDDMRASTNLCIHHTFHETWPDLLAATPVYRNWDGNYAISAHVQLECEQRIGFRPELLRNPIDTTAFASARPPLSELSRAPTVLHPARLLPWKGVHITVLAIDRLRRRGVNVRLVLTDTQRICDWDDELEKYRERIHALIAELNLTDHVDFVSATYSDMPALYSRSDIVVYPTVGEEPLGLVPLEAMSCGRPIVATRSGGISETVVDGITGFLVERGDVDGLAAAIATLINDPPRARAMGTAGASWVRGHFAIEPYVARLTGRYRASIERRRSTQPP